MAASPGNGSGHACPFPSAASSGSQQAPASFMRHTKSCEEDKGGSRGEASLFWPGPPVHGLPCGSSVRPPRIQVAAVQTGHLRRMRARRRPVSGGRRAGEPEVPWSAAEVLRSGFEVTASVAEPGSKSRCVNLGTLHTGGRR